VRETVHQEGEKALIQEKVNKIESQNWVALKKEFLAGPWTKIEDFLVEKDIDLSDRERAFKQTKGWFSEKMSIMSIETAKKVAIINAERKIQEFAKVKTRHLRLARKMIKKGQDALKKFDPRNAEEARKMIATGIAKEREALNMSQEGGAPSKLTQVNFNLPKTRFDELLDDKDAEGLVELIAAIRRERTRRVGESGIIEVQTESK
jgi:hypothetical protein